MLYMTRIVRHVQIIKINNLIPYYIGTWNKPKINIFITFKAKYIGFYLKYQILFVSLQSENHNEY